MDNPSYVSHGEGKAHGLEDEDDAEAKNTTAFSSSSLSKDVTKTSHSSTTPRTSPSCEEKNTGSMNGANDVKAKTEMNGNDVTVPDPDVGGLSFVEKQIRTCCLYFVFAAIGFSNGQRGPSLLDLQLLTDTDTEQASYYVTSGFVGYLVGALGGGVTFDRLGKGSLLLSVSLLGAGLTVATLPLSASFGLMVAMFFVNALFLGVMDSCANSELMRIWRSKARPYMQALHFSYALGGVVSPLYTEPFLAPRVSANSSNLTEVLANITIAPGEVTGEATLVGDTRVIYAFIVTGVYTASIASPFLVFAVRDRLASAKSQTEESYEMSGTGKDQGKDGVDSPAQQSRFVVPLRNFLVAMFLVWLFYFLYVPTEHIFRYYLLTFAVKQLTWTKSSAAHLNSVYWGSWAASRFTGIFITNCLSPARLLLACCCSLILGFVAFLLSAIYDLTLGIWIFTATIGLSMSVVYPTCMLWVEENIFQVNGKLVASIGLISSAGNMANPPLYGYLMENYTFLWFSYLLIIESVVCTLVLLSLFLYNRTVLSKVRKIS